MGFLVIKDLVEDAELDSQALKAISGGRSGLGALGAASLREKLPEESRLVRGLVKGGLLDEDSADEAFRTD